MTISLHSAEAVGLELATRLATRTIALGAETDLGLSVFRGRKVIDDDQVPCVAIIEGSDEIDEADQGRGTEARIRQQFVLLAYVPCDPLNPNDAAHAAIRDMKRAVFCTGVVGDRTMGGLVRRVRYRGRDIGPRGDGAAFVVAALEISAEFSEDLATP